jgi:hypothetical protein
MVGAESDEYVTNEQNMASSWLPFQFRIWEVQISAPWIRVFFFFFCGFPLSIRANAGILS